MGIVTYGTLSSSSANSNSFESSSRSSLSFYDWNQLCFDQCRQEKNSSYSLDFQFILQCHFTLMQPAEFVDLVLIFPAHFQLILSNGCLILSR